MYNEIIQGKINHIIDNTGKIVDCVNIINETSSGVTINPDTGEPTTFNYGYTGGDTTKETSKIKVSVSYTKWDENDVDSGILIPKGTMKISAKNENTDKIEACSYLEIDGKKMFVFGKKAYGFGGNTYKNYILLNQGTKTKYEDEL
jgi:hypothetical protein